MSLPASPTYTPGSPGNVYASTSLAGGANHTVVPIYIGVAGQSGAAGTPSTGSALNGRIQVWNTGGGTVAATNGLQVQFFSTSDTGPNYDTVPYAGGIIATVTSTAALQSFDLPPGQYSMKLTNLDATNAITVEASIATLG